MLAKTCSQIGSDPMPQPTTKMTNGASKKRSPDLTAASSLLQTKHKTAETSRSRSSSTEIRVTDTISHRKSKSPPPKGQTDVKQGPAVRHSVDLTRTYPASVSSSSLMNNPFLASFASSLSDTVPSTAASSVCRDPLCRDPLCPTAVRHQQLLASAASYSNLMATSPYYKEAMLAYAAHQRMAAAAALAAAPPGSAGGTLPYVCNWVAGQSSFLKGAGIKCSTIEYRVLSN